jgi:hypothetical protein
VTRFLDRLASMPLLLMSGTAGAGTVFVDCGDYAIPAPPVAHIAPVAHVHHKPTKHAHRHAAGRHGARMALSHRMCPVWLDETLGGPEGFVPYAGGEPIENTAETDLGGFGGAAGGFGGGGGGGSDVPPIFAIIPSVTPPDSPPFVPPFIPPPSPPPSPVPELSTWVLMLVGLASLGFLRWRRA